MLSPLCRGLRVALRMLNGISYITTNLLVVVLHLEVTLSNSEPFYSRVLKAGCRVVKVTLIFDV